jgi:hypothetical protein
MITQAKRGNLSSQKEEACTLRAPHVAILISSFLFSFADKYIYIKKMEARYIL